MTILFCGGGWPRLCRYRYALAAPGFVVFEAWEFRLLKAWDVGLLQAFFHRGKYLKGSFVTATSPPLTLYLGYGQAVASLLWRGILAFHHDQGAGAASAITLAAKPDLCWSMNGRKLSYGFGKSH